MYKKVWALLLVPMGVGAGDFQFMGEEGVRRCRRLLPATSDPVLESLYKKHLIFYTDKEMPRVYQLRGGVFYAHTNISAKEGEPHGNANVEFPWGHPAGTHRSDVDSFRFLHLPAPIRWWTENMKRLLLPDDEVNYRWRYPDGTVFGEVLQLTDAKGRPRTFTLRTRTRTAGKWQPNVYSPFRTREEMESWLTRNHPEIKTVSPRVTVGRLKNRHPDRVVIDREALLDELPDLPVGVVEEILRLPFVSTRGQVWLSQVVEGRKLEAFAPTSRTGRSFVPKNYDGAYLAVDQKSCMTCHNGTLENADAFEFRRDWYGRVRGDDGIFSFHPFDPNAVNYRDAIQITPRLRASLLRAGLLKHWDE